MITLCIKNKNGDILAKVEHEDSAQLLYEAEYSQGDFISLISTEPNTFLSVMLEDTMPMTTLYYKNNEFNLQVPFGEQHTSYCPKSFSGNKHFLMARKAIAHEINTRHNLALNPYDHHKNDTLYPHAVANVETRGEAVFAARNAINGNTANSGHGAWPFESWGIQRREDAEFVVQFGREVLADAFGISIRCDFPHDNWWHTVSVEFSDGSTEVFALNKTSLPQIFEISPRKIEWAKLCCMKKDETDASPFPALTAFSVFGIK